MICALSWVDDSSFLNLLNLSQVDPLPFNIQAGLTPPFNSWAICTPFFHILSWVDPVFSNFVLGDSHPIKNWSWLDSFLLKYELVGSRLFKIWTGWTPTFQIQMDGSSSSIIQVGWTPSFQNQSCVYCVSPPFNICTWWKPSFQNSWICLYAMSYCKYNVFFIFIQLCAFFTWKLFIFPQYIMVLLWPYYYIMALWWLSLWVQLWWKIVRHIVRTLLGQC